jgi:hypothetical protein
MGAPKGVKKRSYTDAERIGLMTVALDKGVEATAKQAGVPVRTVYEWFGAAGGIANIRAFANEAAGRAISDAKRAVCEQIAQDVASMDKEQLAITFRKLLEVEGEKAAANAGTAAGAQAGASAQAIIVNVDGETLRLER